MLLTLSYLSRYFCTIWVSKRRKRVINVQIYCVALQMSLSGLEFTHELDLIQVFYYYCGQETYLSPLLYRVSLVYNTQCRKRISCVSDFDVRRVLESLKTSLLLLQIFRFLRILWIFGTSNFSTRFLWFF